VTTIDRRVRTERYIEYWVPAGASAKDMSTIIREATRDYADQYDWAWNPDFMPDADDWFTVHPHDEHVIVRIKCPDEAS